MNEPALKTTHVRADIWQEDNWWIVQCLEIDVATQGGSESEALENIIEALELHIEQPAGRRGVPVLPRAGGRTVELSLQAEPAVVAWITANRSEGGGSLELAVPGRSMLFRHARFKLEAAGFRGIRQKPKHAKFILERENEALTAILPHYTDIAGSVLASIQRQSGVGL